MKFEYYAMKVDFNTEKPVLFNIFNNIYAQKYCELEVKKYLRAPSKCKYLMFSRTPWMNPDGTHSTYIYGFEAFKHKIKGILMHEFWARCEYEHLVTSWPPPKKPEMCKVDVWDQIEPNLDCICHEIIRQYRLAKKTEVKKEITYHAMDGTEGTLYIDEGVTL